MSQNVRTIAACAALGMAGALAMPALAAADPVGEPTPTPDPALVAGTEAGTEAPGTEAPTADEAVSGDQTGLLRNVTYRARIDGVSRGALVTYKLNDNQVQSENPTMLPGRVFEAQTVLSDADLAGMQISVQWPYSANLHCEILVDDAIVAQADQFIRPRLTPADDDPDYGKLMCGAPLVNTAAVAATPESAATEPDPAPVAPIQ